MPPAKNFACGLFWNSDRLFPVEEQKMIASHIPGATYHELTSKFGHDGFLLEYDQLTAIIEPLLP
jgi:homoserine O-acetyltransferase